jgi:hypothetical protein
MLALAVLLALIPSDSQAKTSSVELVPITKLVGTMRGY